MIREVIQDWSLAIKQKDPDRVQAMLQNVISKVVVNPDYSVVIQLKLVCLELVPRTRAILYRHIIIHIAQIGRQLKLELLKYPLSELLCPAIALGFLFL
ncbi:MAG: hypothetical protein H6Q69_1098 [Firmicutes bacterium]|nr:hypothetical protein [Bacillota bacterium]